MGIHCERCKAIERSFPTIRIGITILLLSGSKREEKKKKSPDRKGASDATGKDEAGRIKIALTDSRLLPFLKTCDNNKKKFSKV